MAKDKDKKHSKDKKRKREEDEDKKRKKAAKMVGGPWTHGAAQHAYRAGVWTCMPAA